MENPKPIRPKTLPSLAEEILEALAKRPESQEVVIGGGIALQHYVDYRPTQDLDAWWKSKRDPAGFDAIRLALVELAAAKQLTFSDRRIGSTDSLDFANAQGKRVFSFQISERDVGLDYSLQSSWPPIRIETLRDNVGSKMNALVDRGAPRDFLDIFESNERGLVSVEDCWETWQLKNPQKDVATAKGNVIVHLERLEQRRPLSVVPIGEREHAARVRTWYRKVFARV